MGAARHQGGNGVVDEVGGTQFDCVGLHGPRVERAVERLDLVVENMAGSVFG